MNIPEAIQNLRIVAGVGNPANGTACVMSAASAMWHLQQGEEMGAATDELECVCPVVRRLAIQINDGTWESDEARKAWALDLLPRLLGSRGDEELTLRRGYLCADRAVRVFAPGALRARGRDDLAGRLDAVSPIVDRATALAARDAAMDVRASDASDDADAAYYAAYYAAAAASAAAAAMVAGASAYASAAYASAAAASDAAYYAAYAWWKQLLEDVLNLKS